MRSCGAFVCLVTALGLTSAAAAQSVHVDAPPTDSGRFEVALRGRAERSSAGAGQAVWLTVALPLDRLAMSGGDGRALLAEPALAAPPSSPPPESTQPPGAAPPRAADASPGPSLSFAQLRTLSEFTRRATLVALAVSGVAAERRHLDSLAVRARRSAILPELRLRVVRSSDQALRLAPTADDPFRASQVDAAGVVLEGAATFHLERLLFSHDELAIQRLRVRAAELGLKLEARVQASVFGLFQARELGCASDPSDPARARAGLRALELFTDLDQLTSGWFSDQAPGFARALWGFPQAVLGACVDPEASPAGPATNPVATLEDSE